MRPAERKRILFVAEAVTLAHVARPLVLAQSLDDTIYDVHFASASCFEFAFQGVNIRRWDITSTAPDAFLNALAKGHRLYNYRTLTDYLEDDRRLIASVRPDLIVGDFRLSLSVSAALAKVPYAALANAYWSPYSARTCFPLPDVSMNRMLGHRVASSIFDLCQPLIFAYHARPLNRLRRRHGLKDLPSLQHAYTHADHTLYADPSNFYPMKGLPSNHRFLGPIEWSPPLPLPSWWENAASNTEPIIYATLGSSGSVDVLPNVVAALEELGTPAVVATAGRWDASSLPKNVRAADYLPGAEMLKRANLMICNGGSPSVYQALLRGVPVLGIASNMDQMLAMSAVQDRQVGILLRAGEATKTMIKKSIDIFRSTLRYRQNALKLKHAWAGESPIDLFRRFVAEVLPPT